MPTLAQLDGSWPDPDEGATSLIARCHALRTIELADLTPSDLRVLIAQDIGRGHVVPLAIDVVEDDPLVEASYEPGDLLLALLHLPVAFWTDHPLDHQRLREAVEPIDAVADEVRAFLS